MKKHIRSLSLLLSVLLLLSLSIKVPARAQSPAPTSVFDESLLALGYPQSLLDRLPEPVKEQLISDAATFTDAITMLYDEEHRTFMTYDPAEEQPTPCGQLSTSSLALNFLFATNSAGDVIMTSTYEWKTLPAFRWQDPIAVSWDDSLFRMKDDSFSKVDYYDGYTVDPTTQEAIMYYGLIHSEENGYAKGSSSGVSWYADLKGYSGIIPTKLYGSSKVTLERLTSTHGSTTMFVYYAHPTTALSSMIAIPKYGSFDVSGFGDYDECGDQKTFHY